MLKCKEACGLLSQAQDRKLSRSERWRLQLHLMICLRCRRYRKQLAAIRESMKMLFR